VRILGSVLSFNDLAIRYILPFLWTTEAKSAVYDCFFVTVVYHLIVSGKGFAPKSCLYLVNRAAMAFYLVAVAGHITQVAGRSGLVVVVVSAPEKTHVRISLWTIVFIAMTTAICSLGHGLHLTAVLRSTKGSNRVPASAGVRAGMSPVSGGK